MNYQILIPKKFNAIKLLQSCPTEITLKPDKLTYFISIIYNPLDTNLGYDGYTILSSTLMENMVSNYKQYLDYLIDTNMIECNNTFVPGVISKGYKISNLYVLISEGINYTITDKTLLKRFNKQEEQIIIENKVVKTKLPYLCKWFNSNLQVTLPDGVKDKRVLNAAFNLNKQNYRLTIDNYGLRLHSNLTRFNREYRCYIKYDGNRLANIDLKNAQPYFLVKLLVQELKQKHNFIYNKMLVAGGSEDDSLNDANKILFLKYQNDLEGLGNYFEDVCNGTLYTKVQKAFNKENKYSITRDIVKQDIMPIFFGSVNYKSKIKTVFKKLYPFVSTFLDDYKNSKRIPLAKKLQKIESSLILRKIAKKIAADTPRFTIHDSLFVPEDKGEMVEQLILEYAKKEIGFYPNVSVE